MRKNKITSFINFTCLIALTTVLLSSPVMSLTAYAVDNEDPVNQIVNVDGTGAITAHGLSVSYNNNIYLSLNDMVSAISNSDSEYKIKVTDTTIHILTPDADYDAIEPDLLSVFDNYEPVVTDLSGWTAEEKSSFSKQSQALHDINFNGEPRKYYTIITKYSSTYDAFISVTDFCLLFDIEANYISTDDFTINTSSHMLPVNPAALEAYGFFENVNGLLVGDATTGEIYYSYNGDIALPIASTTKLMTYLLTMDAISSGQIGMDDMVTVSDKAVALSKSADGVTPMKPGQKISVRELINGAMLPSSNECALTLAEYIAGDEETFVDMMSAKAESLGITTAVFHNSNGLPSYYSALSPAKLQNYMSPKDMFILASHILNTYPQTKTIASQRKLTLEAMNQEVKNTNGLLYNMPEVNGLKTGTTNRAGSCLVSSLTVNDGSLDHDLIVVLLGAEGSQDRIQVSELMAHYAKAVVLGQASPVTGFAEDETSSPVVNAESIVNLIVNSIIKSSGEASK